MKRVYIACAVLVVLTLFCVGYVSYHSITAQNIETALKYISISPENSSEQIKYIDTLWQENRAHWNLLFGKDMVSPMDETVTKIDALYNLKMYDELVLEAKHSISHIKNIWEYQKISVENMM